MEMRIRDWVAAVGIGVLILAAGGCKGRKAPGAETANTVEYYVVPQAPAMIQNEADINRFYARNWWRDFDFEDTVQAALTDSVYFMQLFAGWAQVLERVPDIGPECVESVMTQASAAKITFGMFVKASREVLADPNSPLRDDELYMPVLRARIESRFTDEAARERCRYRLELLSQNRIGHKANDFRYTLADGSTGSLYKLNADYTLIFINNPGCEMCRTIKEEICASDYLMELIRKGTVRVLAVYPDEDLEEWYKYHDDMPAGWINGYDKGCVIRSESLYNLSAIPSLYLLDKDKTVLVKDAVSIPLIVSVLTTKNLG